MLSNQVQPAVKTVSCPGDVCLNDPHLTFMAPLIGLITRKLSKPWNLSDFKERSSIFVVLGLTQRGPLRPLKPLSFLQMSCVWNDQTDEETFFFLSLATRRWKRKWPHLSGRYQEPEVRIKVCTNLPLPPPGRMFLIRENCHLGTGPGGPRRGSRASAAATPCKK